MHVIIIGGGKVGTNLSKELLAQGYSISIVEKEAEKCERIASSTNALVIHGDGTDHSILESAGIINADNTAEIVACTPDIKNASQTPPMPTMP